MNRRQLLRSALLGAALSTGLSKTTIASVPNHAGTDIEKLPENVIIDMMPYPGISKRELEAIIDHVNESYAQVKVRIT